MTGDLSLKTFSTNPSEHGNHNSAEVELAGPWTADEHAPSWENPWIDLGGEG